MSGVTAQQPSLWIDDPPAPAVEHPARFSDAILAVLARRLAGSGLVLDPFAGTGRVHELRHRGIARTIGVEIEAEWANLHPDTIIGDALHLPLADDTVDAIATSPTYGNRMADHHNAQDGSYRNTYRHAIGRPLNPNNSGQLQWGEKYRDFHRHAWAEAVRVLRPGGLFALNVKDHVRQGVEQDVVAWHLDVLTRHFGLELIGFDLVPTKGLPSGEHATTRTCAEVVATFRAGHE